MIKLILECNGCGYTWYPEKERWEKYPDAQEPDCPNPNCKNYGTGNHPPTNPSIWLKKGIIDTEIS